MTIIEDQSENILARLCDEVIAEAEFLIFGNFPIEGAMHDLRRHERFSGSVSDARDEVQLASGEVVHILRLERCRVRHFKTLIHPQLRILEACLPRNFLGVACIQPFSQWNRMEIKFRVMFHDSVDIGVPRCRRQRWYRRVMK